MKHNRVLNIKEYIKYLLNKWYIVMAVVFIFAIAFIAVGYIKNKGSDSNIVKNQESNNAEELYASLDYADRTLVVTAVNDFEDYYQSFELLDNSIIEKVDSYNARRLTLVYSVAFAGDDSVPGEIQAIAVDGTARVLYYYIQNGGLAEDVSAISGVASTHVQDCFSAETASGSGVVSVTVWGTDVDEALMLMKHWKTLLLLL